MRAGPGTGKTRVLTRRVQYLIEKKGVDPEKIVALTFTKKAAGEMERRVSSLLKNETTRIATFHSLGFKLLTDHFEETGDSDRLTVYEKEKTRKLIAGIIKEGEDSGLSPEQVLTEIGKAKRKLQGPDQLTSNRLSWIYSQYEKKLKKHQALDFEDLLKKAVELLYDNPALLFKYRQRFQYLLLDEYQDINQAQYRLASLLAPPQENIFAVGDPGQCIFSFRGADPDRMWEFKEDYPETEVITLNRNYRNSRKIIQASRSLLEGNRFIKQDRIEKENSEGQPLVVYSAPSLKEEAGFIAFKIEKLKQRGFNYSQQAILYRSRYRARKLKPALLKAGIPYSRVDESGMRTRREVVKFLDYLKLAAAPDNARICCRLLLIRKNGIDFKTLNRLLVYKESRNLEFREALAQIDGAEGIRTDRLESLADFKLNLLKPLRKINKAAEPLSRKLKLIRRLIDFDSCLNREQRSRIDRLIEIAGYHSAETLSGFLKALQPKKDGVELMTIHQSKGREYKTVFLIGLEEGSLPHYRAQNTGEERRLCYVALTRAEEEVILTYNQKQERSRFLKELPQSVIIKKGGEYS